MKQFKSILALLLALVLMVSCFAACGGDNSSSDSGDQGSSESTPADSESSESNDDGADEGEEPSSTGGIPASDVVKGETNQQTYPLVDEKITLRYWYPNAGSMGELADFNDAEFWQWYEEKTNVHIDFILPASGSESDAFQLLFASNDMPDVIYTYSGYQYRGGEDKAIEDGYFVDLMNYLDYCPNYVSWLNSIDDYRRGAMTDTGKLYAMFGVWETMGDAFTADQGLAIRKDYLDKVGKDIPTTYDEWEDVLVAFRDELGISAPFYTSKYGIDYGEFMAGYDTAPYFYQRDGKVQYGPLDDQYKEYLTLLNRWWNEGLLDKDFATRSSTGITADNDMMLNDQVGALIDYGTRLSETYVTRGATNPDFYLVPVEQPKKSAGDPDPAFREFGAGSDYMTSANHCFSADSEYLETAIRWVDGFYAEDVYLNANYGLEDQEGTVWYAAEDGHRIGNYDFRYSNPDGISSATVLVQFWTKNPPVRVEAAQIEQSDENKQSAYPLWAKYEPKNYIPVRCTMTSDEGTEYASKYTDIETYVQECNVKFIMGQMSLDDYDSYRDTLRSMGIEDCIAIKQAALDRYYAREA